MTSDDRSGIVAAVGLAFLIWAWMTVCLRCFVRTRIVKAIGIDDFIMIGALLAYTVFGVCSTIGTRYGTGQHMVDLPPLHMRIALLCWFLGELFYAISASLAKLSVGFFLLRIVTVPVQRRILWAAMIVTAIAGVCVFFMFIFQCVPTHYFWDLALRPEPGTCMNKAVIANGAYVYAAVSATCDFTFGLLPIWIVKDLNLPRRAKATAGVLLGMGAIAGIAILVRMKYAQSLETNSDFLWYTTYVAVWSLIEVGLGISAGSLATTRPLFSRFFKPFGNVEPASPGTQVKTVGRRNERPRGHGWTTWQLSLAATHDIPAPVADDEVALKGEAGMISVNPSEVQSDQLYSPASVTNQPYQTMAYV